MAIAYRAGAVGGTTTNTSNTLSITVPSSGSGGTVVPGDVAVACITTGGNNTFNSAPSGWTQQKITANAQNNITGAIYTKTLVSGDINAAAVWVINAANNLAASIDIFAGANEAGFTFSAWTVGTGTTVTSTTQTISSGGWDMGFWMGAVTAGAAFTFTKDATYTAGSTRATSVVSGQNRTMGTAFISVPGGGSTAGVGCTFSAVTARNAAYAINIAPGVDVAVTGVVSNLALAGPTGTVNADSNTTGVVAGATLAAPTGSVNIDTTIVGSVATLSLAAPAGSADTDAAVAGSVAPFALVAPAGAVQISEPGPVATLDLTAPAGSVVADATLAGPVGQITAAAPTGTVTGDASVTGSVTGVALTAAAGAVSVVTDATVTGVVANLTLAAPAGSIRAGANLFGAIRNIAIAAPPGVVGIGPTLAGVVANTAITAPSPGLRITNCFPNPSAESGGTAFAASHTTVTLGSTDYALNGSGSAKVVVNAAPNLSTTVTPSPNNSDATSNGRNRYAAAVGNTFDLVATIKAASGNSGVVTVDPNAVGYFFNGTLETASTGYTIPHFGNVTLSPGQVATIAGRVTIPAATDPIDGILVVFNMYGANTSTIVGVGQTIYLDGLTLVRNAEHPLTIRDYIDGASSGGSWSGTTNQSSSTAIFPSYPGVRITTDGATAGATAAAPAGSVSANATVAGAVANLAISAATGIVTIAEAGPVAALTVAPHAGSLITSANVAGITANLALTAHPGGAPLGVTVIGAVAGITLSSPVGSLSIGSGPGAPTAGITLHAPAGSVSTGVSVAGATAGVALAAPAGGISQTIAGEVAALTFAALAGVAKGTKTFTFTTGPPTVKWIALKPESAWGAQEPETAWESP